MQTIGEFVTGEQITGFFLIKSVEVKETTTKKRFLDFTLVDRTGEVNAKLWEASSLDEETFFANMLVKVQGQVREWNGQPQLNIDRIRLSKPEDGVHITDFVPSAPEDPAQMLAVIKDYIRKIEHPDIARIVATLLSENAEKLPYYPAAMQNHHAIRSGWLYHITTMLMSAEKIAEVYPFLNTDYLYAGVILHDLYKLEEMEANELGVVSDYTIPGQLLGHLVMGVKNIDRVARELDADEEVSLLLQHLVISHHYKGEWGSPKAPMIPEGEVLHYLDMMDAAMFDMKKALENTNRGEMSGKVWTLGRKIYRRKND